MKRLKYVFVLFFLIVCSKNAFSQLQGCYISGENNIYTFDTGNNYTYYLLGFIPIGPYKVYSTPLPTIAPNCPRASLGGSTGVSCWKSPTSSLTLGTIYNYAYLTPPVLCPLDEYIWILILPMGSLGFRYLRRRSFVHLQEV